MFGAVKSASSYLWGTTNKSNTNQNAHAASHSLNDLKDVSEFEEEKQQDKRATHQSTASLSNIAYRLYIPPQFKEEPVAFVLDKDSKYKLSAASSISFLFASPHNRNRKQLCRYPFWVESNRNRRYCSKMDLTRNLKQSQIKGIGGVPLDDDTEFMEEKESMMGTTASVESLGKQMDATSLSVSSSILSIINVDDLNRYLDSLNLTKEEKAGILKLCEWVKTEKLSIKLCEELWMSEIVVSYFASLSPTNPDLHGTWRRWIVWRMEHFNDGLYNVNPKTLRQFLESGVFSVGFDKQRRPVWFLNTEGYDESRYGIEVITKACILMAASLQWDLAKNEYDLFALRGGISVYVNLSHWSINMASWSVIQAVKKAMVAFPFHLVAIYVSNIPTFMYLLKQLAAKVVVPHALEKVKILGDASDYFEEFANKQETPICAGGTLRVSAVKWFESRGYLDYVDNAYADDAAQRKMKQEMDLLE